MALGSQRRGCGVESLSGADLGRVVDWYHNHMTGAHKADSTPNRSNTGAAPRLELELPSPSTRPELRSTSSDASASRADVERRLR